MPLRGVARRLSWPPCFTKVPRPPSAPLSTCIEQFASGAGLLSTPFFRPPVPPAWRLLHAPAVTCLVLRGGGTCLLCRDPALHPASQASASACAHRHACSGMCGKPQARTQRRALPSAGLGQPWAWPTAATARAALRDTSNPDFPGSLSMLQCSLRTLHCASALIGSPLTSHPHPSCWPARLPSQHQRPWLLLAWSLLPLSVTHCLGACGQTHL